MLSNYRYTMDERFQNTVAVAVDEKELKEIGRTGMEMHNSDNEVLPKHSKTQLWKVLKDFAQEDPFVWFDKDHREETQG